MERVVAAGHARHFAGRDSASAAWAPWALLLHRSAAHASTARAPAAYASAAYAPASHAFEARAFEA